MLHHLEGAKQVIRICNRCDRKCDDQAGDHCPVCHIALPAAPPARPARPPMRWNAIHLVCVAILAAVFGRAMFGGDDGPRWPRVYRERPVGENARSSRGDFTGRTWSRTVYADGRVVVRRN